MEGVSPIGNCVLHFKARASLDHDLQTSLKSHNAELAEDSIRSGITSFNIRCTLTSYGGSTAAPRTTHFMSPVSGLTAVVHA